MACDAAGAGSAPGQPPRAERPAAEPGSRVRHRAPFAARSMADLVDYGRDDPAIRAVRPEPGWPAPAVAAGGSVLVGPGAVGQPAATVPVVAGPAGTAARSQAGDRTTAGRYLVVARPSAGRYLEAGRPSASGWNRSSGRVQDGAGSRAGGRTSVVTGWGLAPAAGCAASAVPAPAPAPVAPRDSRYAAWDGRDAPWGSQREPWDSRDAPSPRSAGRCSVGLTAAVQAARSTDGSRARVGRPAAPRSVDRRAAREEVAAAPAATAEESEETLAPLTPDSAVAPSRVSVDTQGSRMWAARSRPLRRVARRRAGGN